MQKTFTEEINLQKNFNPAAYQLHQSLLLELR